MTWRVLQGDCREVLHTLPEASVQCCVTSPPYWGLRDYGVEGQLGLERTPEEYVANMVAVFWEVHRVLRPDGTLWLNLGDCYCSAPPGNERPDHSGSTFTGSRGRQHEARSREARSRGLRDGRHSGKHTGMTASGPMVQPNRRALPGLKPKDLVGIPWRVAFALQRDGWWLRQEIIWHKPNPMPEAVEDRPTRAHEQLFLLSPSASYFYDANAIKERATGRAHPRGAGVNPKARDGKNENSDDHRRVGFNQRWKVKQNESFSSAVRDIVEFRNRRSVWTIATRPFSGAHFAVMPPDLVEPCIAAGSQPGDVVLDPFAGAGTVGMVARRHGRSFVGIELSPAYCEMARERIRSDAPLFNGTGTEA